MDFAFVVDPLPSLKAYKDSSVAMMRALGRRGHRVFALEQGDVVWDRGTVRARVRPLEVRDDDHDWYREGEAASRRLADFAAVLMRKDPPFDMEYVYSTYLLEAAEREGARVFNRPRAIRDHNEKLAIARSEGARTVMIQRYLPEIAEGDKRVLLIAGEPVPYALARIPKAGETRGNLAAGGRGVARPLSARDREIAGTLGPVLWAEGLLVVGLDVIGPCLTEVNVTSPTCFVEIAEQTGFDVAGMLADALVREVARS